MTVGLNPVTSSNTTEAKTVKESLSARIEVVKQSKPSQNLYEFFPLAKRGIKKAVHSVILLTTLFAGSQMLKSCGSDDVNEEPPVSAETKLEEVKKLSARDTYRAANDSLGIPNTDVVNFYDERIGADVRRTFTTDTTGIEEEFSNGHQTNSKEFEITKAEGQAGYDMKYSDNGVKIGTHRYEINLSVTKDGVNESRVLDTENLHLDWKLYKKTFKEVNAKGVCDNVLSGVEKIIKYQ